MAEHALLSPSSAERWLNCPGSVDLCRNIVDTGNAAADEGTACHTMLSLFLSRGIPVESHLGKTIAVEGNAVPVTQEMVDWVLEVVRWVEGYRVIHPRTTLKVEQRTTPGAFFGIPKELFGTCDVELVNPQELCVVDAKFGYVDVEVEENPQLLLYALGIMREYGWVHDTVRIVIHQPRSGGAKPWVRTAKQLMAWAEEIKPKIEAALDPLSPLVAGEAQCRYCPAAAVCPELQKFTLELARREWSKPELMLPERLVELLQAAPMIRKALDDVEAHALKLAQCGYHFPGFKLVEGNKHRVWKDEAGAEKVLRKLGYGEDDIRPRKLVSPNQAEKLLGSAGHELLKPYSEKPKGPPTLVPESDKRPAVGGDFAEFKPKLNGSGK